MQKAMHKVRVRVDPDLCIGSANCAHAAPQFFQLNQKTIAEVLEPGSGEGRPERLLTVEEGDKMTLLDAADACPTRAIIVEDVH